MTASSPHYPEPHLPEIFAFTTELALFVIGTDETIQSWNPGVEKLLGYKREEFIGLHTSAIFIPQDRAIDAHIRELEIARNEGVAPDERWHLRKDGSSIWGVGTVKRMQSADGEITGYLKSFIDATLRHEQALALRELTETHEKKAQMLEERLQIVSHELRGPLSSALGAMSLLQPHTLPDAAPYLQILQRSINMQLRIVEDLLDHAKMEHGKFHIVFARLDAHQAIEEAVSAIYPELHRKRLEVRIELGATKHLISAERSRFDQIISNILRNAIKFSPAGGTITIRTSNPNDDAITISITDQGIGMTAETIERIFTPFLQGSKEHSLTHGGLGLGLSITKRLIEQHNGKIEVSSEGPDKGSCFTIFLPTLDAA